MREPYRAHLGASRKGSRHIRSFSITMENSKYLDGVAKGHFSAVVNRALDRQRLRPEVDELLQNIGALQGRLTEAYEKIDELTGASQVPDDEAQKVPPSRGLKRFFKFLWP